MNRWPLCPEHGVSGNDEPTLAATDGPLGQSHPSGTRDGLRTGMADMGVVRDKHLTVLERRVGRYVRDTT